MFLSSRGPISGNSIGLHVFVSNEMEAIELVTSASGVNEKAPLRVLYQVDPGGFEPPAFSMPLRRAPNCAMGPVCFIFLPTGAPNPPEGGCVRYGPGLFHFSTHWRSQSPGRGLRALWARFVSFFYPLALPIPRKGAACAMGPVQKCYSVVNLASVPPKMDLEGFEPSASSVRLKRAPNCATGPLSRFMILL